MAGWGRWKGGDVIIVPSLGPTIRDSLVSSTEPNDNLDSEMRNESLSVVHG